MKLNLTAVYVTVVVVNILFCAAFYASQWAPIVSLSLHPPITACGGLQTFADIDFLKLFLVQLALSLALQVSGVWWMTNSVQQLKSFWTMSTLGFLPFLIALMVLKLEPLLTNCVSS
jgi:hypothetical protein